MLSACGEAVKLMGVFTRKTCVRLSTLQYPTARKSLRYCVEHRIVHFLPRCLSRIVSTVISGKLPLFEHNFYPVSTAPIISATKIIS